MRYETKVILASLVLGLGLVIFSAFAVAVKPELWPFTSILALIGGYIAFFPNTLDIIRRLTNKKVKEQ